MSVIGLIAFDGFTDIDVFLHWDLLNRPKTMFPHLVTGNWSVRLLGTASKHVSAAGLEIPMHGDISESRNCDAVLHTSGQATRQLMKDRHYIDRLALNNSRQLVCSQCSGALILAASGLLTGVTATTYPTAVALLEEAGAIPVEEPFVRHDDRNIATAAGCLAGVSLSYWILGRLLSTEAAETCINSASAINYGLRFDAEKAAK